MIRTRALGTVGIAILGSLLMGAATPASEKSATAAANHPTFDAQLLWQTEKVYCDTCHSRPTAKAKRNLEGLDLAHLDVKGETWEKVLRKLRGREMPPAGMPKPTEATYQALVKAIDGERDRLAEVKPNPGRPT